MKTLMFITFLFSLCAHAQHDVIQLDEIEYHSDFERSQFQKFFIENESSYLPLFVATDKNGTPHLAETLHEQLNRSFDAKEVAKLRNKSIAKQVRTVYEKTHSTIFTKYEAENYFGRLVNEGSYNCVTATALFGILFEKLNIPYTIQEKPTHVYAVAYPDTDQIMVESTDPLGGFLAFNDRYKSDFINRMTKAKLISAREKGRKSLNQLFDEYYFRDKDIGIRELIGIQYMNQAVYQLNTGDIHAALPHLEKAYLFYPSEQIGAVLMITTLQNLAQSSFNSAADTQLLVNLTRMQPLGVRHDLILNEFNRALQKLLVEKNQPIKAEKLYEELTTQINDDSLKLEIDHFYHFERGRQYYNQGQYVTSLQHLSQALKLKPEHLNTENFFTSTLAQQLRYKSSFDSIRKELEYYALEHPGMSENIIFTSMQANTYLALFGQYYDLRQASLAEHYRKRFKKVYHDHLNIDQNFVARAYSLAAVYFFRRGNKAKALEMLDEGLTFAPGSYELQSRKRMIE